MKGYGVASCGCTAGSFAHRKRVFRFHQGCCPPESSICLSQGCVCVLRPTNLTQHQFSSMPCSVPGLQCELILELMPVDGDSCANCVSSHMLSTHTCIYICKWKPHRQGQRSTCVRTCCTDSHPALPVRSSCPQQGSVMTQRQARRLPLCARAQRCGRRFRPWRPDCPNSSARM